MKVGILTHYYKTHNYGGILQAYALVRFLRENGFDAEQICCEFELMPYTYRKKLEREKNTEISFYGRILRAIKCRYNRYIKEVVKQFFEFEWIYGIYYNYYERKYLKTRYEKFEKFQNAIQHSDKCYTDENIADAVQYDSYIVGSDQVWNLDMFTPVFFLEYISNKKKIAYAVSAGRNEFLEEEIKYLRKILPQFNAISVREGELVDTYSSIVKDLHPRLVVDPVLLLDKNDWCKISSKRLIKEKYVFAYFLGHDKESKKLAMEYSKKKNLKLVSIPFIYSFSKEDIKNSGELINTAGPEDFISLIQYSECVFTDSFHATAFSIIFKKNFYVFERQRQKHMKARIESLTKLAECEESFCNEKHKRTMEYIIKKEPNDYSKNTENLLNLVETSKEFLISALI